MNKLFILFFSVSTIFLQAQEVILFEDFENANIPKNWKTTQAAGSIGWNFGEDLGWPIPWHSNYAASLESENVDADLSMDYLYLPILDLSKFVNINLELEAFNPGVKGSSGHILISFGTNKELINFRTLNFDEHNWNKVSLSLDEFKMMKNVQIVFHHNDNGTWATCFAIDNVKITGTRLLENNLAIVELIHPQSNCDITDNENVVIEVQNLSLKSISEFSVSYSLDFGKNFVNEQFNKTIEAGQKKEITFKKQESFLSGKYDFLIVGNLQNDMKTADDTILRKITNPTIAEFPFEETFENGLSEYFESNYGIDSYAQIKEQNGNYIFQMQGGTHNNWQGTPDNIDSDYAWNINTEHHTTLSTVCEIDATNIKKLYLKFELKQTSSNSLKYSWFRVMINNEAISSTEETENFHPKTQIDDNFETVIFDLSKFAGKKFSISFQSSCKFDKFDTIEIDNIWIWEEN